jgi:glutamate synthase (NADPH/NADH) small chain
MSVVIETNEVKKIDRKTRLRIPHQPAPKQAPEERVHNWLEVYEDYDLQTAKLEAFRCIQCPAAPCQVACPLDNDIPGALLKLEDGDVLGAAAVFRETNPAPDMCGRLCPQESLCEGNCVVGKIAIPVAIGKLESFAADYERDHGGRVTPAPAPSTGKRVAVVGSGPAGLTVAEVLAKRGHGVKVFDAWPQPGGVLRYGIPGFKMDKRHVDDQVDYLHSLGVQFVFNRMIGRDVPIDQLFEDGYDAVFLGHGAGSAKRVGIPGEDLEGVYTATDFLVRTNLEGDDLPAHMRRPIDVGDRVIVIGGGDTAMDCVRSALRTGADTVICAYRRNETEMAGREDERRHAKEEGIDFLLRVSPVEFIVGEDDESVGSVRLQRMELGEEDESGRRRPEPVPGSEFDVEADTVVVAIGYQVDPTLFDRIPDLEATDWGSVSADDSGRTSRPGVFAAGDNVRGADLVVTALADAKRAAAAIDDYLGSSSEK